MPQHEDRDEIFGELAIGKGLLTPEEVRRAREAQIKLAGVGLRRTLWQLCEERGDLLPEQVQNLKRAMIRERGTRVRIAGYEIIERVGLGGMGQVFRARQISVNRIVALKILSAGLARDATYVDRFTREARLAAKLDHPNVVRVFDFGEDHGRRYLAMEFVEGRSVAQLIAQERRVPPGRAVEIALQACYGLHHAHERGIVHRDVKPSNLLLHVDGLVKVADLGLAKQTGEELSSARTRTMTGTPAYAAPEQAQGLPSDARADIYSLGATLFHMLTGQPPYVGGTPYEVISQHIGSPPPSPRSRFPDIPRALDAIVTKMMAKRPEDRHSSLLEVAADLEALQRGQTPPTAGNGRGSGNAASRRTRRMAMRVAAAGSFLLGAGILASLTGRHQPSVSPDASGPGVVAGEVWAADTDMPLAGVRVVLESSGHETLTDDQGRFRIEVPKWGQYGLRFEREGCFPGRLRLDVRGRALWAGSFLLHSVRPPPNVFHHTIPFGVGEERPLLGDAPPGDLRLVSRDSAAGSATFEAPGGIVLAAGVPLWYYDEAPPVGYSAQAQKVPKGGVFFVRTRAGLYAKCRVEPGGGAQQALLRVAVQADGTRRFPRGPAGLRAAWRNDAVVLDWEDVPQAAEYTVWRREGNVPFAKTATVRGPAFQDAAVRAGETYDYAVTAEGASIGRTDASEISVFAGPARPHDDAASPAGR